MLRSDILIRFCERIPFAWVIIYAINDLGVSASGVAALVTIEMTAAIMCYLPASWPADRYGKKPFVIATFLIFTAFPVALYFASGFLSLAVAFAIRGSKEFGEPTRKTLIVACAAAEARGRAVGAYCLVRDSIVSVAALVGAALWQVGPAANFGGLLWSAESGQPYTSSCWGLDNEQPFDLINGDTLPSPRVLLHGIFRFDCHTGTEAIHDEKHPSTCCDFGCPDQQRIR